MNTQTGTYRCTFTLPRPMAVSISQISKRLRMSQSAFLTLILEEPIEALERVSALLPLPDAQGVTHMQPEQMRRLRGVAVDELRKAVKDALDGADAIDPAPGLDL
jgi:uncharacterized protein YnzC (UPF0291/DUF896 family)